MYKSPGTNEKDVIKNMKFTRSIEKKDFFNRVIKSQSFKDGAIDVKKIKPTFIEKIKKDQILLGKFQEYLLEFQLYFSIMCNMICNNEDRNIEHMAYRMADLFKKRDEYVGAVKEEDYLRELNIPMKLGIDIDDEPYENDDDNLPFN